MTPISRPLTELEAQYDAVVVGSGYGGGVAASRMARMGLRVAVLERGLEILPGAFPDTMREAARSMQIHSRLGSLYRPSALYDLHVGDHISVLVGCGLGGTSLINAGVSLAPDLRVFSDPLWPAAITAEASSGGALQEGFARAAAMLQPRAYPEDWPRLNKFEQLEVSGAALGTPAARVPINVRFESGPNAAGVYQPACNLCGDCCSGCNTGAKNTTAMNYLADAAGFGARIFCGLSVDHVARAAKGGWRIAFKVLDDKRDRLGNDLMHLHAQTVVLAGGTLGSTRILLRSREEGLDLSPRLGERFSGNGDILGFGYNNDAHVDGIGMGDDAMAYDHRSDKRRPVGPTIIGAIDMRDTPDVENGIIIEEGAIPGGIAALLPSIMAATAAALGEDSDKGDWTAEKLRELESLVKGPRHGAVAHTQTYLVMSHDNSDGKLALDGDRLAIHWPDVGHRPQFQRVEAALRTATAANGGTYVPNPIWTRMMDRSLITVHPLGGCPMADSADAGVVNANCQVFTGAGGLHEGLLVCDGAVLPRSVGVNPLLSISAVAERAMIRLAERKGLPLDTQAPTPPLASAGQAQIGLRFTEKMGGRIRPAAGGNAVDCHFVATITVVDAMMFFADRDCEAEIQATIVVPFLSDRALSVVDGRFKLFSVHPEVPGARAMEYHMPMVAQDGSDYLFIGRKTIHDDPGFDVWADTTTLECRIIAGHELSGPLLATGELRIAVPDFLKQLSTMEVLNAPNIVARARTIAGFARLFGTSILDSYL